MPDFWDDYARLKAADAFGDYDRFSIRDVAASVEDCDMQMVGGTHLAKWIIDYRVEPRDGQMVGDSYYAPLVAALGKAYIEECMLAHPAGNAR